MTVHDTAIKVDVYPDEFMPIMKAIKYALINGDTESLFDLDERDALEMFLDALSDLALEYSVH